MATSWAQTTLSTLDAWCGSTCHTALRYVLRTLLLIVLMGALASVVLRSLDAKRGMQVKKKTGLDSARSLLGKRDLGSVAATFRDAGVGAKMGKVDVLDDVPDVKDSCSVM